MAASHDIIELLAHNNYRIWSRQISRILQIEGLYSWLCKDSYPDLTKLSEIDKLKLEQSKQKTASLLKLCVSPDIELVIGHLDNPSEIWKTLKEN